VLAPWTCAAIRVSTEPTISAITSVPGPASLDRVMLDRKPPSSSPTYSAPSGPRATHVGTEESLCDPLGTPKNAMTLAAPLRCTSARALAPASDDRDLLVVTLLVVTLRRRLRPCGRRCGQGQGGSQAQGRDTPRHDESPVMNCRPAQ